MNETRTLIARVLDGDPGAFTQIVSQNERLVGQIVFRMIPNETDREDLCQDVFFKVYRSLEGFKFQSKLSTWIARIAYNTCLSYLDKKKLPLYEDCQPCEDTVEPEMVDGIRPDEWTESRQTSVRVCEEIDRLPVIYGTIVSLYHLNDMSYDEIGKILSLPDGTVKSYLFRARRMLKERLLQKFSREELCA